MSSLGTRRTFGWLLLDRWRHKEMTRFVNLVVLCLEIRGSYRKSWATFFACELGTADEGEYGARWNQLLCYPWVSCDVNSLHHVTSITPNKMADLAPSDYHLFGFVKDQLRGQRYETTEAIQKAVRQCRRMAGTEFYRRGIFKLPERWEKCVQRSGDYVEK